MKETSLQNGAAGLIARASQHFSSDALVRPQSRIEERVRRPWSAFDVVTLAPTLAMPLFVIHDRGDAESPWQHGMAITRAWRGADLLMTEGLGHRRILSPSWPPPAYPVGSRLPWRKRRRPRRLSVSSWSSSKSRLATTTGRLPLCGPDEPTRYSSKARSRSIGIGSASSRLPPSTSSLQSTSGVWQRYLRARAGLRAHLIIPCSDQATLVPWPFGGTVGRPIASRWWPARRLETPPARRASQRQAVEALDDG